MNDCYAISRRLGGEEGFLSYKVFTDGVLPNNPVEVARTQRTIEEYNYGRDSTTNYFSFDQNVNESYNLDREIQELSVIS